MTNAKSQAHLLEGLKTHQEDPFLNISTVAMALGKSPQTIGRWVLEGAIAATPWPSGGVKIRKSDLEKLLAGSPMRDDQNIVSEVDKLTDESD